MLGDGTYMMTNSDIYSSVRSGHKMIVVVCDNSGYAVISRLQQAKGVPAFNNLLKDCRVQNPTAPLHVDFAAPAAAMGAASRHVESLSDLAAALEWAKTTDRTTVISITTDAYAWCRGMPIGMWACQRYPAARACRKPAPSKKKSAPSSASGFDMTAKPPLKAKLGIAPIAWWNDDLAELSDDVTLEECLRQASVAGFTGMETGRRFPMDMDALGPILNRFGISVCGGWFSGTVLDDGVAANKDRTAPRWISSSPQARRASSMAKWRGRSKVIAPNPSSKNPSCRRIRSRPMPMT